MARHLPTEEQVIGWYKTLSNWGRWGADDQLGTLNYITPQKRLQAVKLVKDGVSVSCARPVEFQPSKDVPAVFARHFMERTGEGRHPEGSSDAIVVSLHGGARTHLDSPSHRFWEGKMYNGRPAELVTASEGAKAGSVDVAAAAGVVTRGVLLDIARLRGVKWMEAGEAIFPEDLETAEKAEGVRVEEGDVLLVRTGHTRHRVEEPLTYGAWPGMQAACLPWLHERRVAAIGTDSANDVSPAGYPKVGLPVHGVGIAAMGLWLIDHCNHEELSAACNERNRWEFFFTMGPLNLPRCTGSLVNPLAIF